MRLDKHFHNTRRKSADITVVISTTKLMGSGPTSDHKLCITSQRKGTYEKLLRDGGNVLIRTTLKLHPAKQDRTNTLFVL